MIILGINAYHGDSSACIIIDGQLVAAVEEERFKRIKHWAGFPLQSIRYCLEAGKINIRDIEHIAINRNPKANLHRKIMFTLMRHTKMAAVMTRFRNALQIVDIRTTLSRHMGIPNRKISARIHYVEHHRAHLASTFFVSPFESATVISIDGFGDFSSTMWGMAKNNKIHVLDQVLFPHSLGQFYLSITQFLGFKHYGDEYKVMGLAAYGRPTEVSKICKLIQIKRNGKFELNMDYFVHHIDGTSMTWNDTQPVIRNGYSNKFFNLLGPERKPDAPIDERHQNIAASAQVVYENVFFHVLQHAYAKTRDSNLCLAGGCAFNSVANGKITKRSKFKNTYVQAAAGDAGGALGAAYYVWNQILGQRRSFVMHHAFWGPGYPSTDIASLLNSKKCELEKQGCHIEKISNTDELCRTIARAISDGKVVGWFQGKLEWGPRALGNRSILCDPRNKQMKHILNIKIKHRENFRPFAPTILREAVCEWFEEDADVPFMTHVYFIKPDKRNIIPAVTHVDGTGRLQTIAQEQNPLYYKLICAFRDLTGVPIVLNTSFNENEPIVCLPSEAMDCFLRTKMDALVLGEYLILRGDETQRNDDKTPAKKTHDLKNLTSI